MSGSGGTRSDSRSYGSGQTGGAQAGGAGGGAADSCMIVLRGPINSPQAAILAGMVPGNTLQVAVDRTGAAPVLVVERTPGVRAGSLTMANYLSVITCIDRGFDYEATIMTINGGIYDVRIARV